MIALNNRRRKHSKKLARTNVNSRRQKGRGQVSQTWARCSRWRRKEEHLEKRAHPSSLKKSHSKSPSTALERVCSCRTLIWFIGNSTRSNSRRRRSVTQSSTQRCSTWRSFSTSSETWRAPTMKRIERMPRYYKRMCFIKIFALSRGWPSNCTILAFITPSSFTMFSNSTIWCLRCSTNTAKERS